LPNVFAVTDILMLKVFHSENVWLELGTYIVFYAIAFGGKKGICVLWDRFKSTKKENN